MEDEAILLLLLSKRKTYNMRMPELSYSNIALIKENIDRAFTSLMENDPDGINKILTLTLSTIPSYMSFVLDLDCYREDLEKDDPQ